MSPSSRLAVSLTRREPALEAQVAAAVAAGAALVELRVDLIEDVAAIERVLRAAHEVPYILTIRRAEEGGAWNGDEADRIALLERLALLQPGYVDVELATSRKSANIWQKIGLIAETRATSGEESDSLRRARNRLILSHHDYHATPSDLDAVHDAFDRAEIPPNVIRKLVFTPSDTRDALRILDLLRRRGKDGRLIALGMGEAGVATRVLARKFGSFLTFVALRGGAESAPGQPTIEQMRGLYRWEVLNEQTRVYGVVGWPVAHSRGPWLHNAAMAADGINGVYLPLPVRPEYEALAEFMAFVTANAWLDLRGMSVTLPHKEHVLRWLCEHGQLVSDRALRVGAVNTLFLAADGEWMVENTDVSGALAALETLPQLAGDGLSERAADVVGAGGVARAVVGGLRERGCAVTVYSRTRARAERLAGELDCRVGEWERRDAGSGDVLVNCTSIGMTPHEGEMPVSAARFRRGMVVFDTIYTPRETRFLREAAAAGCAPVDGEAMFLQQAAAQYRLWHDRAAPVEAMRAALAGSRAEK